MCLCMWLVFVIIMRNGQRKGVMAEKKKVAARTVQIHIAAYKNISHGITETDEKCECMVWLCC